MRTLFVHGKIYDSAASCANEIGICMGTVAYRCRNQLYGFAYYKDGMDINNINIKKLKIVEIIRCEYK